MENVLRCLNRVDRFLEANEPGLRAMRMFMHQGIAKGVDEACEFAERGGICDKKRVSAIFKEELSMIIDHPEENELRLQIRAGLTGGVREAVNYDGAHEREIHDMFRQVLDDVWQDQLKR